LFRITSHGVPLLQVKKPYFYSLTERLRNQHKNREKRDFFEQFSASKPGNSGQMTSMHAQSGPMSKSVQNNQKGLHKYGQYVKRSELNSVFGGFKSLSFFTIQLLIAQKLR
jgi:hypothetical protein